MAKSKNFLGPKGPMEGGANEVAAVTGGPVVAVLEKTAAGDAGDAFVHWEQDLAREVGVPVGDVAHWRGAYLMEGVGFIRSPRLLWTEKARRALLQAVGLPENVPAGQTVAAVRPLVTARVLKAWGPVKNRHILMCHVAEKAPESNADLIRVRVPDNTKWRRGQDVPARWPVEPGNTALDYWRLDRSVTQEVAK